MIKGSENGIVDIRGVGVARRAAAGLLAALLLTLLAAACRSGPAGSGPDSSGTLSISPNCGRTYQVEAGRPLEVVYGLWGALGRELTGQNAEHLTVDLTVDGQPVAGRQEPVMTCEDARRYFCRLTPGFCSDGSFWVAHRASLGPLAPGEHEVIIIHTFDQQVSDGYDSDEDGQDDTFGPGQWERRRYVIVAK